MRSRRRGTGPSPSGRVARLGNEFFEAVAEVLHWAEGMRRMRMGDTSEMVLPPAPPPED